MPATQTRELTSQINLENWTCNQSKNSLSSRPVLKEDTDSNAKTIVKVDDHRPRLLFTAARLAERAIEFKTNFPGRVSYAVKANDQACVLKELAKCGITVFDVASCVEIDRVLQAVPEARLHYHNPVKSRPEIVHALNRGCRRFVVDHISEMEKIAELAPAVTNSLSEIEISVRFRLNTIEEAEGNAVLSFDAKFGVTPTEASVLLSQAHEKGFTAGLTFHPGSQCLTSAPHTRHVEAAGRIEKDANVTLAFLNVGGGFPSRYADNNEQHFSEFFKDIAVTAAASLSSESILLECEPGRALVAPAFRLQTFIKAIRQDRGELTLSDGIYGCLMECYQFPDMMPRYRLVKQSDTSVDECGAEAETIAWITYGPTCDPEDRLPRDLQLPADIEEGDMIEFIGVGAYANATATRFHGYGDWKIICVD